MRIMLIDDDNTTHVYHNIMISDAGIDSQNVRTYLSATSAIEELKKSCSDLISDFWPDVIIIDINMPLMSGWDFVDEFRRINPYEKFPQIYLVTNSDHPKDLTKARESQYVTDIRQKFLEVEFFEGLLNKKKVTSN